MTATNHALTGAVIGVAVGNPFAAIPLAFISHFVLDALPHFASDKHLPVGSKSFAYYLAADAAVCVALVVTLANLHPANWLLAAVCAFVATSPDLMWVRDFIAAQNKRPAPKRKNWLVKLHSKIQWYQKEPGIAVEVVWAATMLVMLAKLLVI